MSNEGKFVKIHYTGTLDDGTKFDASRDHGAALEFKCMSGAVIPGFDKAVIDMVPGEKKTVHIEPEDAYGNVREDLIQTVPLTLVDDMDQLPPVGEYVVVKATTGEDLQAKILDISDDSITLDINHPLAGQALNFEIELLGVTDPDEESETEESETDE